MQGLQKIGQGYKLIRYEFNKEIAVPEDWSLSRLSEVCDILDAQRIPIEESERRRRKGNIPYYGASGIIDYIDDFIFDERLLCLAEDGENLRSRVLPVAFIIEGKTWVNNHAHVLKPKEDAVDIKYLDYFLNHKQYEKYLSFTAQPKLTQEEMKKIMVLLPPLIEQQKIASMLSKVDELTQKTDQIIEQTQRLKKGLMQRLLTKGIGHSSFKNTLGMMIPKEWNISSLGEVSTKIVDMDHKMPKKIDDGIPFLSVAYLTRDETPFLEITKGVEELEYISEDDYNYYSKRFNAEHYDLLISRYGTIGVVRIINTKERLLASYSIALIKLNRNFVNPLFMVYFLNSSIVKKQISFMTQTSSNTNLGVLDIKRLKVCIPCLDEQQKIASILSPVDSLLQRHQDYKSKLKELKNTLMKELLTGKLRVKV